jgi:addiction module RelB/DinJ family antitoxin
MCYNECTNAFSQKEKIMPKTATLTIRLDPALKKQTERVLNEMGLTPSQAITLFYKQIKFQRRLPFEIRLPKEPNEETLQAMDDLKNRNDVKTFKNVSDLAADLES